MTGPEHYREAEQLAAAAAHHANVGKDWNAAQGCAALAQVHATLALAAATALNDHDGGSPVLTYRAWKAVACGPEE